MTECDVRRVAWRNECLFHAWSQMQQPAAFAAIFEGLDKVLESDDLADELARHDDFCELAAQVAVIRKLQRELADRDATDADHAALNLLRSSRNPWLHREAGNLLVQIADDRGQVAAHDGEVEAQEKRYRLRCGAIVVIPKERHWSAAIKFIDVSQADFGSRVKWGVGEETFLIHNREANPLNWKGGAHGVGLDIIEEVTE
jgi:hypothetical protein